MVHYGRKIHKHLKYSMVSAILNTFLKGDENTHKKAVKSV